MTLCGFFALILILETKYIVSSSNTLLFATSKDVRSTVGIRGKKIYTIVKDLNEAVAIDFLYQEGLICWTDHGAEVIQCTSFNGTNNPTSAKVTVAKSGVLVPDGLACDWLTRKLYWTDSETNKIEVVSIDSKYRKVLFWQDLDQPRGIAVDPLEGLVFWTDWGESPRIEKAAMDGNASTRNTLVSDNVFWPNSLTLDLSSKSIYWIDGKLNFVEYMDYDGRNRRTLTKKGLLYPFAITASAEKLFWSDWKSLSIYSWDIKGGSNPQEIIHGDFVPMDIKIWDGARQPFKSHPCERKNGGCSHLCLLTPYNSAGFTCACPTGIKLVTNVTCANHTENFLLLVQREAISVISLDSPDHTNVPIPVKGVKHAMGVDYDTVEGYLYWTDDGSRSIQRARLDGSHQEDVISADISNPDGIAIDWIARNMYWTDMGTDRIEVARLDGKFRKAIVVDDLGEPRAIAVAPKHGWIFWSDWYEKKPKIERSNLDGTDRITLVRERITWPNGIALDYEQNKLYWGDAKMDKIEVINMDGSDRREVISDNLPHVFGVTLSENHLYWTDWQRRTIDRANKNSGRDRKVILDQLFNVMGLKAVDVATTPDPAESSNPCRNNVCQQLCFSKPNNGYLCACQIGYELSADNRTCVVPESFMLFATGAEHIRRAGMDPGGPTYRDDVIPIGNIKSITGLDVLVSQNTFFWTDAKARTINCAFANGSHAEMVVQSGIVDPRSLAVDWLSENLYWIDDNRVEVCRVDGSKRKTLFWNTTNKMDYLTVAPNDGVMFWVEWKFGDGSSVVKAALDGRFKTSILRDKSRIYGLTLDPLLKRLYLIYHGDYEALAIEMCDYKGESRRRKELPSLAFGTHSYSTTLYGEHLYVIDYSNGFVTRIDKYLQSDETVRKFLTSHAHSAVAFHSSRQPGELTKCGAQNGDCVYLCLTGPDASHTCVCPNHYSTDAGGNCVPPEKFVMIARRNMFSRVAVDSTSDVRDVALQIEGVKTVKAAEYDPVEQLVYWIDGKSQSVKRAYVNGTHAGILATGQSEDESFHFFDIALDPISRLLYWSCSATDTINVTRLNNTTLGAIHSRVEGEKPRYLAIHYRQGLLYWSDVGRKIQVVRARLDGQRRTVISPMGLECVDALAVDQMDDDVYFSCAGRVYMVTINGRNGRWLYSLDQKVIAMAVMGEYLYWTDGEKLRRVNKLSNVPQANVLLSNLNHGADVISVNRVEGGGYACANNSCSQLCVVSVENASLPECSCVHGLSLAEDGVTCTSLPMCGREHFTCATPGAECIPRSWVCDGNSDCLDGSDEGECSDCKSHQFRCELPPQIGFSSSQQRCIDISQVCDQIQHCSDGSDEMPSLCRHAIFPGGFGGLPVEEDDSSTRVFILVIVAITATLVIGSLVMLGFCKIKSSGKPIALPSTHQHDQSEYIQLQLPETTPLPNFARPIVPANTSSSATSVILQPPNTPEPSSVREDYLRYNLSPASPQTPCSTDVCGGGESDDFYKCGADVSDVDTELYCQRYGPRYDYRRLAMAYPDSDNGGSNPPPTPLSPSSEMLYSPSSSLYFSRSRQTGSEAPPPSPTSSRQRPTGSRISSGK